jgi:hypothetical protein
MLDGSGKRLITGALGAALGMSACGGEVIQDNPSALETSGTSGTSGVTGSGGTGGMGGAGGATSTSGGGVVTAAWLSTDVPRFVIFKADAERSLCFQLVAAGYSDPRSGVATPPGWSVERMNVSAVVSDCSVINGFPGMPESKVVMATGGAGSILVDEVDFPCAVTVHVKLTFDAAEAWAPSSEPIDADKVALLGGGCR